jgi:cytidyltransferase-like protein
VSRVYTGGTFDCFHAGHVDLLKACYRMSLRTDKSRRGYGGVTVALNTDEFVQQYKGKTPVCSYEERETVLKSCQYVMDVVPNLGGADSKPTIMRVQPEYIVIGADWQGRDYHAQMDFTPEWLTMMGITLVYQPRLRELSSTAIKQRMRA